MSDGLTVPFALAAGLTGAISQSHLIVTAGFAEITAGSIAMGLGGYLAARGDAEHYTHEQAREEEEIRSIPEAEAQETRDVFQSYGLSTEECDTVVNSLRQRPRDWVSFMMRFELGLQQPDPSRAWKSALTIAIAYIVGGVIPLSALHSFHRCAQRLEAVGGCHTLGAGCLRRYQGTLHRRPGPPQRPSDQCHRWPRGCGCLRYCAVDYVISIEFSPHGDRRFPRWVVDRESVISYIGILQGLRNAAIVDIQEVMVDDNRQTGRPISGRISRKPW